jgi:SAF domain-containing protein
MSLPTSAAPAGHSAVSPDGRAHSPGTPARLPRQRRRSMLALGVALVALGALTAVVLFHRSSHQRSVLVVAQAIPAGTVITQAELSTATISGTGMTSIPASQAGQVAGKTAAVGLTPGTLLVPGDLTSRSVPGPGQQLVPVALKASQLPASGLKPGDHVVVVATPGTAGQQAGGTTGQQAMNSAVPATVYQVSAPDQNGNVTVDLLVTAANGPPVAEQDSTGQIALIVTPRNG